MHHTRKCSLFCCILFSFFAAAPLVGYAQETIFLPEGANEHLTGSSVFFVTDESNSLTFRDVRNKAFTGAGIKAIPNFGYSSATIWLKLRIDNRTVSENFILMIENPALLFVEAYFSLENNSIPFFSAIRNSNQKFYYSIPLPKGTYSLYLKIKSNDPVSLPLKVVNPNILNALDRKMDLLQGLYIGIILSLLLYNLFIFISLFDYTYLFYVVYLLFTGLGFTYIAGYLPFIGIPLSLNEYSVFPSFAILSGLAFGLKFLNYRIRQHYYYYLFSFCIVFFLIAALVLWYWGWILYANVIVDICNLAVVIYLPVLGVRSFFVDKYRPALFYLLAWTFFLICLIVLSLKNIGVLPFNMFTHHSAQIGHGVEGILLSFALADKISFFRREKEEAEKREKDRLIYFRDLLSRQNDNLQVAVQTRTSQLEASNRIKDRLFAIVAHDLRNPLYTLSGFLKIFQNNMAQSLTRDDIVAILKKLEGSVENVLDLTENLLTWGKLQMEGYRVLADKVSIKPLTDRCVTQLLGMAQAKEITIRNFVEAEEVFADQNDLVFVIRNLLSNAVKFTHIGGTITIKAAPEGPDRIAIHIQDTGIGIPATEFESLFQVGRKKNTNGTLGEPGTGLGLILCKEIIVRNNGDIRVKSEVAKGSVFTILLQAQMPVDIALQHVRQLTTRTSIL
jgi:two-component system, sensor histidine kinase LadS